MLMDKPWRAWSGWLAAGLCLALVLGCASASPQAREAYTSLKRLEGRTNHRAWYAVYTKDLAEAQLAVSKFLATEAARKNPKLTDYLESALFDYELAGKIWDILRLAGQSRVGQIQNVCIKRSTPVGQVLVAYLRTLGSKLEDSAVCGYDEIEISRKMAPLWEHASQQLKQAGNILGR